MQDSDRSAAQVRLEAVAEADAGQRIDNFLLRRAPGVPRSHIYRVIRTGQVRVDGGRVKPTRKLVAGEQVRIPPMHLKSSRTVTVPDSLQASIAQSIQVETDDFLLINKPAGLAVHAGTGVAFGVIDALRQSREEPGLELVHRLDRGTSGCLLVARDAGKGRQLQALFRERTVQKSYVALLDGVWRYADRTVDARLSKNRSHAGERRVLVSADGQSAVSHFSCQQQFAKASSMRIEIETGRTHQIRVHAKHCGHAVIGDTRYGDNATNAEYRRMGLSRLFLHAQSLNFEWQGKQLSFEAPVDEPWQNAVAELEKGRT